MSSSRKSSTKSHHDRSVPDGSSLQHVDVVPKVEFSAGSIDPEEVNAYWVGRGEVKPPVPGLWVPSPFKANPVAGCPSRGCPNGLAAIRRFCRVPELVEFRLPEAGEVALSPPEGNFTCYEAYLMQCHLWFLSRSSSYNFSTVSTCQSAKLIHAVCSTSLEFWCLVTNWEPPLTRTIWKLWLRPDGLLRP